ncbi:MAG TPA: alpha/beta fold hydrolase, partial [Steroidobacteraceae bacterium]|nr:alpha/beta fold hydrolase [Steroidobacteraceae bacterium]
ARVQWLIMIDSLGLRPKQSPARAERDIPLIVLLHGIYCAGAIWNPIVRALSTTLSCEIVAPSLTPTSSGLIAQAQCFGNWLEQHLAGQTQRHIVVIAHSMGGLVMRQYFAHAPSPVRIDTLICVSTPFRGSRIAEFLRTPIGRDLRPDSPAIQRLQTTHWPISARITVIASAHDNLVIPADSAHLPDTQHIDVNQFGHLSLLYSRELLDVLLELLHTHKQSTTPCPL